MENQACNQLKIRFPRRSLAYAQTSFSSVILSLIDRQYMQSRYSNTAVHRQACSERSILADRATISSAKFAGKRKRQPLLWNTYVDPERKTNVGK